MLHRLYQSKALQIVNSACKGSNKTSYIYSRTLSMIANIY